MEALKKGILFSLLLGAGVFAVVQALPSQLVALFSVDAAVIAAGTEYLRTFSFDYLLVPFVFSFGGLVIASGHTVFSLVLACSLRDAPGSRRVAAVRPHGPGGGWAWARPSPAGRQFPGLWFVLFGPLARQPHRHPRVGAAGGRESGRKPPQGSSPVPRMR